MKLYSKKLLLILIAAGLVSTQVHAQEKTRSNQVFFRGGIASLMHSRGNEVFTDTGGAAGVNGDKRGLSLAAGIDLAISDEKQILGAGTLLGEVYMEYDRFSSNSVRQTTSALLAGTNNSNVMVSQMNVAIAPKLRIDSLGVVRPFVIPGGMAWLVNSPPSNDSTYLDFGIPFAAGIDLKFMDQLSVGMDLRYTLAFNDSNTENSSYSVGGYAGINF